MAGWTCNIEEESLDGFLSFSLSLSLFALSYFTARGSSTSTEIYCTASGMDAFAGGI